MRHWGSFSSERATHPRMSMAFEFLAGDVSPAIHQHAHFLESLVPRPAMTLHPTGPLPSLRQRLYLIGRQIMRYHEPPVKDGFHEIAAALIRGGYPRNWSGKMGNSGWATR